MRYQTGNPVEPNGSSDPRDLFDNSANMDLAVNSDAPSWVDRTGTARKSFSGMEQEFQHFMETSGYEFIGDYDADGPLTITSISQVFSKNGEYWRAGPDLTLPYITVNNWASDQSKFVSVGDAALRQELASATGSNMVSDQDPRTGSVQRSVRNKLGDLVSAKDFGAVGNGVANDAPKLQAANDAFSSGQSGFVLLPVGTYKLDTDVVANSRSVTFLCAAGAVFTGVGKLKTNVVAYDATGAQYGKSRHAYGSNTGGGGILVGGGALDEGGNGTFLKNDGHANWLRAQTSVNYNPTEIVIYGAAGQGRAVSVVGGGFIDRTAGTQFDSAWVGKPFYFNRKAYLVRSWVSVNRIELEELNHANVAFVAATFATFHFVRTSGSGLCSVSGTTVTRVSGQPFIPFVTYPGFQLKINGTPVTVAAFVSPDQLTLSAAPGNSSSAPFVYELDINAQISTIRVQKMFGTDEENLTLSAKANGEYEIRVGTSGNGENYPLRFYNGATAPYTPRPVAIINEAGRFGISNSTTFSPAVLAEVLSQRTEAIGTNQYNEMMRISTVWNSADYRGVEVGTFGNGAQGGYLQGRDYGGTTYDLALNPRGGNVGIGLNNPVMKLTVAGVVGPAADNLYSLGQSGARWSVVWAATGTINTSARSTKTDIEETKLGLDFITALQPKQYRFKVGGHEVHEVDDGFDEVEMQATEIVMETVERKSVEVVDGRKVLVSHFEQQPVERPVFDIVDDIHDAEGNLLPPTSVPRMVKVQIPRTRQEITERAGVRLHHGLIADEVKSACDAAGVDFAGYVMGEDGLEGLRYEQFIAPLIRSIHELTERISELEAKTP